MPKRDPVEEARVGDVVFAQNDETGEVASRAGGWSDVQTMSKAKVRKLVDEYIRDTAAQWVEAAGIADEIDAIIADGLGSIVAKLIEKKTEEVAERLLAKLIEKRLAEVLAGPLPFTIGVTIKPREIADVATPPTKKRTKKKRTTKKGTKP